MKTQMLAQWAETISSLVVVITLIFLSREVQRNTAVLKRQAKMALRAHDEAPCGQVA